MKNVFVGLLFFVFLMGEPFVEEVYIDGKWLSINEFVSSGKSIRSKYVAFTVNYSKLKGNYRLELQYENGTDSIILESYYFRNVASSFDPISYYGNTNYVSVQNPYYDDRSKKLNHYAFATASSNKLVLRLYINHGNDLIQEIIVIP